MKKTGMRLSDDWIKSSYSGHAGACVTARPAGGDVEFGDSKFGREPGYATATPVLAGGAALVATVKALYA